MHNPAHPPKNVTSLPPNLSPKHRQKNLAGLGENAKTFPQSDHKGPGRRTLPQKEPYGQQGHAVEVIEEDEGAADDACQKANGAVNAGSA